MLIKSLTEIEQNVLLGSIFGDGTLTKIGDKTRRVNSNYREHFGQAQLPYRKWKVTQLQNLLYFNKTQTAISSKSQALFTELEAIIYGTNRIKQLPAELLSLCTLPHFLAVLYLDDGSLSISHRINHRLRKVYLTPHIYLYLQSFQKDELERLQKHIERQFGISLTLCKRSDGSGYVLKTNTVASTLSFLDSIKSVTGQIPEMNYKSDWTYRYTMEQEKWTALNPGYDVLTSNRKRSRAYTTQEIQTMSTLKQNGHTDQQIADVLGRSYWSVVYKLRDLRLADSSFKS